MRGIDTKGKTSRRKYRRIYVGAQGKKYFIMNMQKLKSFKNRANKWSSWKLWTSRKQKRWKEKPQSRRDMCKYLISLCITTWQYQIKLKKPTSTVSDKRYTTHCTYIQDDGRKTFAAALFLDRIAQSLWGKTLTTWVHIGAIPSTGCVTLNKVLCVSVS